MTPEEHNKTLATLYFIYGAMHGLTLIGLLLLVFAVKFASPTATVVPTIWLIMAAVVFAVLFMFVGLLPVLLGIGFLRRKRWVRPLGLPLAIVSLINIPIGTALGIYTLKFLRSASGAEVYGGRGNSSSENELVQAMQGAQPLMNLADRLKQ